MADLRVTRASPLDLFLRSKDFQQWRILVLVNCGAVKIFREGAEIPLKDEKTHVRVDDIVRIPDPLPQACQEAMQKAVNDDSRDYAFVPGKKPFDIVMGTLIEARLRTNRIKEGGLDDLERFIWSLQNRSDLITYPVRHVIVASHANDEGYLFIKLGRISGRSITYEDLEKAAGSSSLKLDIKTLLPRPTTDGKAIVQAQFIIRGCRIGKQKPFLQKLREALGNQIPVFAPKHFHEVFPHRKPPGVYEYMGYSFEVTRPTELKTRDEVVKAMIGAGFTTIDKQPVQTKQWDQWIPRDPTKLGEQELYTKVFMPIVKEAVSIPFKFRHLNPSWLSKDEPLAVDRSQVTDADRKEVLKKKLETRPEFQKKHALPVYKRYGYETFDEFMDGWNWTFKPRNKPADQVQFNAARHEYIAIPPITQGKKQELVLNFYPTTKKAGSVIEMLQVDNTDFFEKT